MVPSSTPLLDRLESDLDRFVKRFNQSINRVEISPEQYLALCQETWEDYEPESDDSTIEYREVYLRNYWFRANADLAGDLAIVVPEEDQ